MSGGTTIATGLICSFRNGFSAKRDRAMRPQRPARLAELEGIPELEFTADARDLASRFLAESAIPAKSLDDAIHVAIATVNGMDFLATWNCRHIVNAQIMKRLVRIARGQGIRCPFFAPPNN